MKKGERVKNQIVRACIKLFSEHGFFATSFQMIADECQIGQTTVIYHFKEKKKLVEEVVKYIVAHNHQMVSAQITPKMNAKDRLRTHMKVNLEWAIKHKKEAQIILLLYYFSAFDKTFASLYQVILKTGRERMLEYLWAGKREGLFQFEDEDADYLAQIIHDELASSIIPALSLPKKPGPAAQREIHQKWDLALEKLIL